MSLFAFFLINIQLCAEKTKDKFTFKTAKFLGGKSANELIILSKL